MSVGSSPLEERVAHLELVKKKSMRASVTDYYRRTPSRGKRKGHGRAAFGTEKELYPQLAYILLSSPGVMIPTLLRIFRTEAARRLLRSSLAGRWRAYRLSTIRPKRGVRWTGPRCFPGAAGQKAIADIGFFLEPSYDRPHQIRAKRLLYLRSSPVTGTGMTPGSSGSSRDI